MQEARSHVAGPIDAVRDRSVSRLEYVESEKKARCRHIEKHRASRKGREGDGLASLVTP